MGLLDKFKNLFTEEIEEEVKPVKRETVKREVVTEAPKRVDRLEMLEKKKEEVVVPEEKEEKFVFPVYFDDKDFDDLKKPEPKPILKPEPARPVYQEKVTRETRETYSVQVKQPYTERVPYQGAKPQTEITAPPKKFVPSPIISPVYGVLDKNYKKDDINTKKERPKFESRKAEPVSVDDIRNKAFGTLEDDLEVNLFGHKSILFNDSKDNSETEEALDLLKDLNFDEYDKKEQEAEEKIEKVEHDLLQEDFGTQAIETPMDPDTAQLARELEEQRKKLEAIDQFINESKMNETEPTRAEKISELRNEMKKEMNEGSEQTLNDSDLFQLIDSMYEKRDEE